nr:MAG: hypothetical protein DIU70_05125 [Bacillota bacterium]
MALHVGIEYVAPVRAGIVLVAEARELHRGRRTALYGIEVREEGSGRLVAACHGRVYRTDDPVAADGPA